MLITPPLHCSVIFFYTQYMLTLSDASYDTKEILKWGGLFIAGMVILVTFFIFVKQTFFPTPPPKPTIAFGKLPPQLFPKNVIDKTPTYTINTLSGALPQFPNQTKIFSIQLNTPDLSGLSNATEMAKGGLFTQGPNKISDILYEWTNPDKDKVSSNIDINIVNYNFNVTSDYLNNSDILSGQELPSPSQSIIDAKGLLVNLNSFPADIDETKTQTVLLSIKNGALTPATSFSSAQIVKIMFYQKDVNLLPIYYEKPDSSNIDALVGTKDQVVELNYNHQTITDAFSTYPLKTSQQAFADLQQGYAYIASYEGNSSNISINNVLLAYYIGTDPQAYLMPIFVFEGNDNFIAYVPAVTDEWINK